MNILYLTLIILSCIILVSIMIYFIMKSKQMSDNSEKIEEIETAYKNNIISKDFYDFLQNPTFSITAPSQGSFYLIGTEYHKTDKYYSQANNYFVIRRGYPFVIIKDPNFEWDMDNFKIFRHKTVNVNYKKFSKKEFVEKDAMNYINDNVIHMESKYNNTSLNAHPDDTIKILKRTKDYIICYTDVKAQIGIYSIEGLPCLKKECQSWQTDQSAANTIKIHLIFNPYHKDDIVYMNNNNLIENYVLEENGLNHQGSSDDKNIAYWNYDQFNQNCLDGAFRLYYFLSSFDDFDPDDLPGIMRGFTFGTNAVIISGLWPTPEQQSTLDIFRKDDASDGDKDKLSDNFNKPFTPCIYNSDCADVFKDGLINGYKITNYFCSANVPSKYSSEVPKTCALNPSNPFELPYFPSKDNKLSKTCTSDTDCSQLKDWDGSNNMNQFAPITTEDRRNFTPSCIKQNVCSVDIWNGGISPQHMQQSSTPILANYVNNHTKTRWGECWVYAGIITTLCRTLGIPCRQISAYQVFRQYCSQIPNDGGKLCQDAMGKFDGICIAEKTDAGFKAKNGFLWSFHMWNNVWFNRQDFKDEFKEYNGASWQIIDATPQELSYGLNQLGPCPLKCVKSRFMNNIIKYDSCFLNTEVNYTVKVDDQTFDTQCEVFTQELNIDFKQFKGLIQFDKSNVNSLLMKNINDEYISK